MTQLGHASPQGPAQPVKRREGIVETGVDLDPHRFFFGLHSRRASGQNPLLFFEEIFPSYAGPA